MRFKFKKKITLLLVVLMCFSKIKGQNNGGGEANPNLKTNKEALQHFQDLRFGMFIHWGPVTLTGTELSWSRGSQVPVEEYDNLYKEFNPVLFSAKEWVKTAKDAGMKYIVLTTKHHDGFSLWDSQFTEYDMANTPYGKGIIKSLADECKKQNIDFGIYYSIGDWKHPDYPVSNPSEGKKTPEDGGIKNPQNIMKMKRHIVLIKKQLKELIENYDPTLIWFDGGWEWPWTHEMGMDLYAYLRGIKDDLLINNRIDPGLNGEKLKAFEKLEIFAGDYLTPEQHVGSFDKKNAWETCMTIGTQWSWKPNDKLKSKKKCIQTLLQTVGGDGNLLFNVGPMMDGRIEKRQIDRLKEMGDWLKINGEAVYGTRGGPYKPTDYMVSTHKKNKIYLHLLDKSKKNLKLPFPTGVKIKKAYFLDKKTAVNFTQNKDSVQIDTTGLLYDDVASVLVLELSQPSKEIKVIERFNY